MKDKSWSFTTAGDVNRIDVVFVAHTESGATEDSRFIGPFRSEVDLEPTKRGDICLFDVKMEISERIRLIKGEEEVKPT